ncbi:MAG: hypothetical protein ACFHU9_12185 [Fluviicola sp.]
MESNLLKKGEKWWNPLAKTLDDQMSLDELKRIFNDEYRLDLNRIEDRNTAINQIRTKQKISFWNICSLVIPLTVLLFKLYSVTIVSMLEYEGINVFVFVMWSFVTLIWMLWTIWKPIDLLINREYHASIYLESMIKKIG